MFWTPVSWDVTELDSRTVICVLLNCFLGCHLFFRSRRRTSMLVNSLGVKSFTTGLQLVGLKEKVWNGIMITIGILIGSEIMIVNLIVVYQHDVTRMTLQVLTQWGTTKKMVLQRLLTLPGYSWRRKGNLGNKGGVDGIYLGFYYICLSDFLLTHIVTTPPPLPPLQVVTEASS